MWKGRSLKCDRRAWQGIICCFHAFIDVLPFYSIQFLQETPTVLKRKSWWDLWLITPTVWLKIIMHQQKPLFCEDERKWWSLLLHCVVKDWHRNQNFGTPFITLLLSTGTKRGNLMDWTGYTGCLFYCSQIQELVQKFGPCKQYQCTHQTQN